MIYQIFIVLGVLIPSIYWVFNSFWACASKCQALLKAQAASCHLNRWGNWGTEEHLGKLPELMQYESCRTGIHTQKGLQRHKLLINALCSGWFWDANTRTQAPWGDFSPSACSELQEGRTACVIYLCISVAGATTWHIAKTRWRLILIN